MRREDDSEGALEAYFREALGVDEASTEEDLTQALAEVLSEGELALLRAALSGGGKTDVDMSGTIATALAARGFLLPARGGTSPR